MSARVKIIIASIQFILALLALRRERRKETHVTTDNGQQWRCTHCPETWNPESRPFCRTCGQPRDAAAVVRPTPRPTAEEVRENAEEGAREGTRKGIGDLFKPQPGTPLDKGIGALFKPNPNSPLGRRGKKKEK